MRSPDRLDSAEGAVPVILDVDLPPEVFAINCEIAGRVAFIGYDNRPGDVYVAAGIPFPLRVRRIVSAGTTAQGLRGLR